MPNVNKHPSQTQNSHLSQEKTSKSRAIKVDPAEQTGSDKMLWREQKNTHH